MTTTTPTRPETSGAGITPGRPDAPRRATGLTRLTLRLTTARFAAREGEALLYAAGVLAFTIASALALTVAGGTWMFYNRWQHPHGLLARVLEIDPTYGALGSAYFALAVIACALLIPGLVNLAAGAAVLGARGRERRLAALRLLGVSSGEVTRMSLLDVLLQALAGTVLGTLLYLLTLPLWRAVEMMGMPLEAWEMRLPVWLYALVAFAVVLIGLLAAWRGLRQVRISPLGVSRRANKPRLSWLRAVVFVLAVIGAVVAVNMLQLSGGVTMFVVLGAVILGLVFAMNLAAPWILQLIARALAHLPGATMRWSARRIAADPAATWRRVSGLGVLAFVGGFMALMPITIETPKGGGQDAIDFAESAQWDFTTGVMITLAVGFVLTAASLLISQASATIERAEQTRALHRMGAPAGYSLRVMWFETFGPLLIAVGLGTGLGVLMAQPMHAIARDLGYANTDGMMLIAVVIVVGLVLTAAALLASHPLYHRQLATQQRRND